MSYTVIQFWTRTLAFVFCYTTKHNCVVGVSGFKFFSLIKFVRTTNSYPSLLTLKTCDLLPLLKSQHIYLKFPFLHYNFPKIFTLNSCQKHFKIFQFTHSLINWSQYLWIGLLFCIPFWLVFQGTSFHCVILMPKYKRR